MQRLLHRLEGIKTEQLFGCWQRKSIDTAFEVLHQLRPVQPIDNEQRRNISPARLPSAASRRSFQPGAVTVTGHCRAQIGSRCRPHQSEGRSGGTDRGRGRRYGARDHGTGAAGRPARRPRLMDGWCSDQYPSERTVQIYRRSLGFRSVRLLWGVTILRCRKWGHGDGLATPTAASMTTPILLQFRK